MARQTDYRTLAMANASTTSTSAAAPVGVCSSFGKAGQLSVEVLSHPTKAPARQQKVETQKERTFEEDKGKEIRSMA